VTKLRHEQPGLWTGITKEDLGSRWEPWMRVDGLEDEALLDQVYEAQECRLDFLRFSFTVRQWIGGC
jgi:hypothetical protein